MSRRSRGTSRAGGTARPGTGARVSVAPGPPDTVLVVLAAGVVAAAAVTLGWLAFFQHPIGDYFTESDFYEYATGARALRSGHLDFSRYAVIGPLYEFLLAAIGPVFPDVFRAGETLSIVAACTGLGIAFELVRRRLGAAAGLWTVALIATNGVFMRYGYSATTDMTATCLQWAALFALLAGRGPRAPLWAGLCAALAVLTRYSAAFLLPAALLHYLWIEPPSGLTRRRALGLYVAGFGALTLPWAVLSALSGQVPGAGVLATFSFYADTSTARHVQDAPAGAPAQAYRSLGSLLRDAPLALAGRTLANLPAHLTRDLGELLRWPIAALLGAGVGFAVLDGAWRRLLPLALQGACLFAILAPIFYSDRYSLPLLLPYLAVAAWAIASPRLRLTIPGARLPLKWMLALWPIALAAQTSFATQRFVASQVPTEVLPAADALRRHARPGERVLSRKPHVGHYAGVEVAAFPRVTRLDELATYCRGRGVRYLYFSWYEAKLRPEFRYLLDLTAEVPGLERIFATGQKPAVLYRIGPEFGRDPEWLANDTLHAVHLARAQVQIDHDRDAWPAHLVLAEYARVGGDCALALRHYERSLGAHPQSAPAWRSGADCARRLGRTQQAVAMYQRALSMMPGDVTTLAGLGLAYLDSGSPELAARAWRPVAGKVRDPALLRAMVGVFHRLGDREALETARRALEASR